MLGRRGARVPVQVRRPFRASLDLTFHFPFLTCPPVILSPFSVPFLVAGQEEGRGCGSSELERRVVARLHQGKQRGNRSKELEDENVMWKRGGEYGFLRRKH